jgi:serine/threonine protein kinase
MELLKMRGKWKEKGRSLDETLGEGGMGLVYLAEREDLGSKVAIKVLGDAWLSPARRQRFGIEQRTLAQLNHPCIARLYDAGTSPDGTPFFVMEYVDGVPLTEYCRKRLGSVADRLRLFRAVCEVVQYAHQQAVIHRDLNPSNILVKEDGSVRLLDFGIAKRLGSFGGNIDQTIAGLHLMTLAYASPEQIRGDSRDCGNRNQAHRGFYQQVMFGFINVVRNLPHKRKVKFISLRKLPRLEEKRQGTSRQAWSITLTGRQGREAVVRPRNSRRGWPIHGLPSQSGGQSQLAHWASSHKSRGDRVRLPREVLSTIEPVVGSHNQSPSGCGFSLSW